ncbi:MAG TPA: translocation/assembly module TamB domain-containing protein [Polyangiales bacterium]|nr:translocation/assembly module TamB domain-containing protein [Polyangiales bacterium]
MRIRIWVLGVIAFVPVVVVGVLFVFTQTDRGRGLACDWIVDAVNRSIPGRIETRRCDSLGPSSLRLSDVTVRDPGGRAILTVQAVEAQPDWSALLTGKIGIERARAEAPSLRLVDYQDELAIVSAFAPPAETDAPEEDEGVVEVVLGVIEVADGTLTDLPEGLSLHEIRVRTSLAWRGFLTLDVARAEADARQQGEVVARLLDASSKMRFDGEAHVQARTVLEVRGNDAEVDGEFHGSPGGFSLSATVRALQGEIEIRAENDGARLDVRMKASELRLSSALSGARGVGTGELHTTFELSEPTPSLASIEHVEADLELAVSDLQISEIRARALTVDARVEGLLPTPEAHAVLEADGVEVQGNPVERLRLIVDGRSGRYDVIGSAPLPNGWIVGFDLSSKIDWPRIRVDGNASLANAPFSPLTATFSELIVQPGESISVASLRVSGRGVDLSARGRYGLEQASDLSFELASLDLGALGDALEIEREFEGELRGSGRFRGSIRKPELQVRLRAEDAVIDGVPVDSAQMTLDYTTRNQEAEASARIELADEGAVSIRANAKLERASRMETALRAARYDAHILIESLPLDTSSRVLDGFPTTKGTLSAELRARGELDALDVELAAYGRRVASGRLSPTDVFLEAKLDGRNAHARLEAATQRGSAIVGTANARLNLRQVVAEASMSSILDAPWELSLRIPEQRVSRLPVSVPAPTATRMSLDFRASGGSEPIRADFEADFRFPRGPSASESPRSPCPERRPARARATARLRSGRSELDIEGYVDHQRVLSGKATADTPVDAWIAKGLPTAWPSADGTVELDRVLLGAIPWVCEHAEGEVRGRLAATDLFAPSQQVSLRLHAHQLVLENETPVDVVLEAEANATRAVASADMGSKEGQLVRLDAHVPIRVREADKPLALGAGEARLSARFDRAPLSILLSAVPIVARPEGRVDGDLTVVGDARDPSSFEMRGSLQLADASMTLKDPFIRLDEVDADLEILPEQWVVRSLSVHDRDGRVEAEGTIDFSGWEPEQIALTLEAHDYPLRREGVPVASLRGQIEITGDLTADPRVLRLQLGKEVSLVLPDELHYGVQSLTQHPLVIYEGEPGFDRSLSVEAALEKHQQGAPQQEAGVPLIVHVTSSEPFWVRRPDFSVQLGVDVEMHGEEDRSWLQGEIELRRGFLVLLTKNFDVKSGSIRFTGSTPIDPTVDLRATHRMPSGYVVNVDVEGRVSAPELSFSTDAPGADTNAEIVALLLGVSRQGSGDQQAESQTRSVLAGLTAGLVGSLARRELGQYAPIIAIESQGTAETTRIRAGVTVGDLVPDAWQDVLLGVYVEGILAGAEQGPRGGFLLELLFPHYLSTTTTYEQPDNWSLDFLWQP